ncbi:calcium ABC transporter ATPase, partial [Bacillus thuringiensis]|nr:calcium ABC transporter ATPase [Bacillus thuringiensis]
MADNNLQYTPPLRLDAEEYVPWKDVDSDVIIDAVAGAEGALFNLLIPGSGKIVEWGVSKFLKWATGDTYKPPSLSQEITRVEGMIATLQQQMYNVISATKAKILQNVAGLFFSNVVSAVNDYHHYLERWLKNSDDSDKLADLKIYLDKGIDEAHKAVSASYYKQNAQYTFAYNVNAATFSLILMRDKYLNYTQWGYGDATSAQNFYEGTFLYRLKDYTTNILTQYNAILKLAHDLAVDPYSEPYREVTNRNPLQVTTNPLYNGKSDQRSMYWPSAYYGSDDNMRRKCNTYMVSNPYKHFSDSRIENQWNNDQQRYCNHTPTSGALEMYINAQDQLKLSFQWNAYNRTRNVLTQTGLDFIAIWPYFDPIQYPPGEVTADLTRMLYSDLAGAITKNDIKNVDDIDNYVKRQPDLFEFLKSSKMYTRNVKVQTQIGPPFGYDSSTVETHIDGNIIVGIENTTERTLET